MRRAGATLHRSARASLVAEHRLQTRRLSSCGSLAQLLRGMWDLPRPGLKPVSPALAGRFSTTAPPGKPPGQLLMLIFGCPHIITLSCRQMETIAILKMLQPPTCMQCFIALVYDVSFAWKAHLCFVLQVNSVFSVLRKSIQIPAIYFELCPKK